MGESFGRWELGADAAVMPHISSANIACGAHAGDPAVMRRTLRLATAHGVACGAHPGFADLAGFGRREIPITPAEARDLVLWQLGALAAIARSEGVQLRHVKAHGALYNMAARDAALGAAIAAGGRTVRPQPRVLRAGGITDAGRRTRGRPDGRGRRICRSRLRTGRLADAALGRTAPSSTTSRWSSNAPSAWSPSRA